MKGKSYRPVKKCITYREHFSESEKSIKHLVKVRIDKENTHRKCCYRCARKSLERGRLTSSPSFPRVWSVLPAVSEGSSEGRGSPGCGEASQADPFLRWREMATCKIRSWRQALSEGVFPLHLNILATRCCRKHGNVLTERLNMCFFLLNIVRNVTSRVGEGKVYFRLYEGDVVCPEVEFTKINK